MWKKYLADNGLESEIHPISRLLAHYQGADRYLHESYNPNHQLTEKIAEFLSDNNTLSKSKLYELIHELSIFCVSFYARTPKKELGFCEFWQPAIQSFDDFVAECGLLRIEYSAKPVIKPLSIITRLKKDKNYAAVVQTTLQ